MLGTVHRFKIFKIHGVSGAESASVVRSKWGNDRNQLGPQMVHFLHS
jgi:hypothetical protein